MQLNTPATIELRAFARRMHPGALLQVLASLLWIAQAGAVAVAVQRFADGGGVADVVVPAVAVLAVGLLRAACETLGARLLFKSAREHLSALRLRVAKDLGRRSPLDSARPASGLAASALAEQAESLMPYLTRYQPARWRVNIVTLAILCALLAFSWTAALVLALAAPLIPLFMAIVGWRAKAASEEQMIELGGMNAFLLDRLRGLSTLRALGAIDATALRLRASAHNLRQRTMAVLRIAFLSSAVLELFAALGVAMVAVYVGFHLLGQLEFGAWGHTLSLGEGFFILLLAPAFFEPLRELSAVWHDRAAGEAALDVIAQMTQGGTMAVGVDGGESAGVDVQSPPSVKLDGIVFFHAGEKAFFEDRSLHIAAGEHVALLGPSGCGKSTLLALIAGLAAPQSGQIQVGGIALDTGSAAALRQRMGWMGQKPHVFAGSVQSNVSLGRSGVDRSSVQHAMRFADLESVARAHPSSALGEGGVGLSGGEAVRLALARMAVDAKADLLLVDEPTAHLDTETARRVADALLALAKGKTMILATHDPVLAARMHRVVRVGPAAEALAA